MRNAILLVAALGGVAHADDTVNLLVSAPTTVAVSSTVANANILPEHLVDGKLATAWNSQTGELAGAWIAVRVPADAKVKTIKLTAGFTQKDKKLGDLFTLNPRIKKVRVSQGGKVLVEKALDIENRGLQEIPVDIAGGDFEIRVVDVVPGKKKNWRETCVSELEVWGTTPKIVKSKPSVRIRSLDAPPTLTPEQCVKAVFPDARGRRIGADPTDDVIVATEAIPISSAIVVCRIDHKAKDSKYTTVEIASVKRAPKSAVIAKRDATFMTDDRPNEGTGDAGSVTLTVFPLTTSENVLIVETSQGSYGPMMSVGSSETTMIRVGASGLEDLIAWKSHHDDGEDTAGERCELIPISLGKTMPTLEVHCETYRGHFHDENADDRGIDTTERTEKYVWKAGTYTLKSTREEPPTRSAP
jgi:hypothetical protein